MTASLLVVTPMRNEVAHVERLARSMAAQSRTPDAWVLVDDGSTDGTAERARSATAALTFASVLAEPQDGPADTDARLARAAEAAAFNGGLLAAGRDGFDLIAKVDADVELPPLWFSRLEAEMLRDPRLGIAGGALEEPGGRGWRRVRSPGYHVHGAVKLYRRECFDAIGGVRTTLGWDTIDETYARMGGWSTRTLEDLVGRHHRPCGAGGSALRGRARYGRCAYVVRYGFAWVALRSLKVALSRPFGISGAAFLWGYVRAVAARAPRVEDPEFQRFVRAELRRRSLGCMRR